MKFFLMDCYTQKAAPGLHEGKNEDFQKIFILHLQLKMGGGYTRGVIHARGITVFYMHLQGRSACNNLSILTGYCSASSRLEYILPRNPKIGC